MGRRTDRPRATGHDVREILPGLCALGVAIALSVDLLTYKVVGYDLAAYILGARRLLLGEPLYQSDVTVLGPFGQFVYPPPVALLFVVPASLPFDLVRGVALVGLAALAAGVVAALVRPLRPASRYWAAAAGTLFFPLVWEVGLENLTLVTLALCLLAWRSRRSAAIAGTIFALALGLKLLPAVLIAHFVAAGRRRLVAWTGVAFAVAIAASFPWLSREWIGFVGLLRLLAVSTPGSGTNIVPVAFSAPALRWILPALAVLVAVATGLAAAKAERSEAHAFRVALAAVPLLSSTVWYPYLVFALPLLLADAPPPPTRALARPFRAVRPIVWVLMEWQAISEPGRDFLLPIVGLLLLIAVGLAEIGFVSRAAAVQPTQYQSAKRATSTAEASIATTT